MTLLVAALALVLAACRPNPIGPWAPVGPSCELTWGSAPSILADRSSGELTDVRAGTHRCFDRLVLEFAAPGVPGWTVEYADRIRRPGSGFPVPVRGGAELRVIATAPAFEPLRVPTWVPSNPSEAVDVSGLRTFEQLAYAGSFEGQSKFALGVRAHLPFRVLVLDSPGTSRLVIDVAHRWS